MIISIPLFIIEWLIGVFLALVAILFAEVIALFVNKDGNLPFILKQLFQPRDNPCWGDESWAKDNPTYSKYRLSASYLRRNAAYGYQSLVSCPTSPIVKTYGDTTIRDDVHGKAGWFLVINEGGYFELVWIIDLTNGRCVRGEYGWSLINTSKELEGSLQLVLLARFMNFVKG